MYLHTVYFENCADFPLLVLKNKSATSSPHTTTGYFLPPIFALIKLKHSELSIGQYIDALLNGKKTSQTSKTAYVIAGCINSW
jgi:hypothetical protein